MFHYRLRPLRSSRQQHGSAGNPLIYIRSGDLCDLVQKHENTEHDHIHGPAANVTGLGTGAADLVEVLRGICITLCVGGAWPSFLLLRERAPGRRHDNVVNVGQVPAPHGQTSMDVNT